jgi:hypothetical protein
VFGYVPLGGQVRVQVGLSVSRPGRMFSEGTSNYVSYGLFEILFRLYWLYWLLELVESVPPFLLFISCKVSKAVPLHAMEALGGEEV